MGDPPNQAVTVIKLARHDPDRLKMVNFRDWLSILGAGAADLSV
jgi:hypothetical protein